MKKSADVLRELEALSRDPRIESRRKFWRRVHSWLDECEAMLEKELVRSAKIAAERGWHKPTAPEGIPLQKPRKPETAEAPETKQCGSAKTQKPADLPVSPAARRLSGSSIRKFVLFLLLILLLCASLFFQQEKWEVWGQRFIETLRTLQRDIEEIWKWRSPSPEKDSRAEESASADSWRAHAELRGDPSADCTDVRR